MSSQLYEVWVCSPEAKQETCYFDIVIEGPPTIRGDVPRGVIAWASNWAHNQFPNDPYDFAILAYRPTKIDRQGNLVNATMTSTLFEGQSQLR